MGDELDDTLYVSISEIIIDNNTQYSSQELEELSKEMFNGGMLEPLEATKIDDKYKILDDKKLKIAISKSFKIIPIKLVNPKFDDEELKEKIEEEEIEVSQQVNNVENTNTIQFTNINKSLPISPFTSNVDTLIDKYVTNEYKKEELNSNIIDSLQISSDKIIEPLAAEKVVDNLFVELDTDISNEIINKIDKLLLFYSKDKVKVVKENSSEISRIIIDIKK